MSISKDKTRTLITISKELKQQLEDLSSKDNRSFNNYIVTILTNHTKKEGTQNEKL